jgi:hypothetical protein
MCTRYCTELGTGALGQTKVYAQPSRELVPDIWPQLAVSRSWHPVSRFKQLALTYAWLLGSTEVVGGRGGS